MPDFVPGVQPDMPASTYHAIEAMSASGAKKMLQSPKHYRLMRDEPGTPSPAMQFGTVVHCGILEPLHMNARVAVAPDCDKRTKAGKETWSEFLANAGNRIVLTAAELTRAQRCIDAVREHPAAQQLLAGAAVEVSLFWNDGKYHVPCKARFDARNHGGVIDVKTCSDASPEQFARDCARFLYHVQAAHYYSGAEHALNATPEFFALICVESEPPHAVACYELDMPALRAGAHLANIALARYADALAAGAWPGYPDAIQVLHLPRYALRFDALH